MSLKPLPNSEVSTPPKPAAGPLVEDATRVGGIDSNGRAVIKTKPVGAPVQESMDFKPTDSRE